MQHAYDDWIEKLLWPQKSHGPEFVWAVHLALQAKNHEYDRQKFYNYDIDYNLEAVGRCHLRKFTSSPASCYWLSHWGQVMHILSMCL